MSEINISYLEPVQRAFAGMKSILFAPFDIGKWFVLGFTAWLAVLGENGGSFNFNWPSDREGCDSGFGEFVSEYIWIIVPLVILGFLLLLALMFVVIWVSSRGRMMFLDNVVFNRAEVVRPWREFKEQGNSLFRWILLYLLGVLVSVVPVLALPLIIAIPSFKTGSFGPSAAVALLVGIPLLVLWLVFWGYVWMFMDDFLVPLMHRHRENAALAWRRFRGLFRSRPGTFVLYGLWRGLMSFVYAGIVIGAGFATCCCGFLILVIPYLGTVVMLPILTFDRLFTVEFLAQFGPDFDDRTAQPPTMPLPAS